MISARLLLFVFAFYLLVGNASRIIPFSLRIDGLPVLEFLVYVCAFLHVVVSTNFLRTIALMLPISCIILASTIYGMFYNQGFDLLSTLYAGRLIVLIYTGYAIGDAAYRVFFQRVPEAVFIYCCLQSLIAISALILLYYFPDSAELWDALGDSGVEFKGDPHKNRLVSVYFDPNFYSVIVSLPLLLSFFMFVQLGSYTGVVLFGLMSVALALTFSRSGIATFALSAGVIFLATTVRSLYHRQMKLRYLVGSGFCAIFLTLFSVFNYDLVERVVDRFTSISADPSAYARLSSLQTGVDTFMESPFFGVGYNYLSKITLEQRGLSALDSSVLTLVCNFGVIGSFVIALYLFSVFIKSNRVIRQSRDPDLISAFEIWLVYVLVVVFFSSSFNNVVFYPFWLIQQIAIGVYLTLSSTSYEVAVEAD